MGKTKRRYGRAERDGQILVASAQFQRLRSCASQADWHFADLSESRKDLSVPISKRAS